jgi:hypothetical protein
MERFGEMELGLLPTGVTAPAKSAAHLAPSRLTFRRQAVGMRSGIATTLADRGAVSIRSNRISNSTDPGPPDRDEQVVRAPAGAVDEGHTVWRTQV